MRVAHEKSHGEVEDYEYPSKDYLARRLNQREVGELLAEGLEDVTSDALAGDDRVDRKCGLEFDQLVRFSTVRRKVQSPTPKNEEELRAEYRLMHIH